MSRFPTLRIVYFNDPDTVFELRGGFYGGNKYYSKPEEVHVDNGALCFQSEGFQYHVMLHSVCSWTIEPPTE